MTVLVAAQQTETPDALPSRQARLAYRGGQVGSTAGVATWLRPGQSGDPAGGIAGAFHRFCQLNPKPCPIIGMSDVGSPHIPGARRRSRHPHRRAALPRLARWRGGGRADRYDHGLGATTSSTFVLGCSFSFEEALLDEGMPIRHIEQNVRVPMFRTNIACGAAGPFAGPMVVSMRPFKPADAIRAVQITSRFPAVHGAPVHLGLPHLIGIQDIAQPDYGDPVPVAEDEMPVFWACGVTPQSVIDAAKLPFAITHAPGLMMVTDLKNKTIGRALMGSTCCFFRLYASSQSLHSIAQRFRTGELPHDDHSPRRLCSEPPQPPR